MSENPGTTHPEAARSATDLDARYGRRPAWSPARRRLLAILGVCIAVLAVVAFYRWWAAAQDAYGARVQSFSVESDTLAVAEIEVTNPDREPLRCEVVAKDRYTQVVGTSVISSGGSGESGEQGAVVVVPTTLTTTGRAVVVVVRDCGVAPARVP